MVCVHIYTHTISVYDTAYLSRPSFYRSLFGAPSSSPLEDSDPLLALEAAAAQHGAVHLAGRHRRLGLRWAGRSGPRQLLRRSAGPLGEGRQETQLLFKNPTECLSKWQKWQKKRLVSSKKKTQQPFQGTMETRKWPKNGLPATKW